jgi:hypothetical protein
MAKSRKYFTLLVNHNGLFSPEFGDYNKAVVMDELLDYVEQGYSRKRLKIIATNDHKLEVMSRVDAINSKLNAPKVPKVDYAAILEEAHKACNEAQEGMVEDLNAFDCGFAWVTIDGRHGLAKWARAERKRLAQAYPDLPPVARMHMRRLGDKAWPGGWQWWCPGAFNGQAVGIHLAGSEAFASVLKAHGIDVSVDSRLD